MPSRLLSQDSRYPKEEISSYIYVFRYNNEYGSSLPHESGCTDEQCLVDPGWPMFV